jgi:hypothetical protein
LLRRQAQVPHYSSRKKSSTSLLLQKKMKHLLSSSKQNQLFFTWKIIEAIHFFLKKQWGTSFFFRRDYEATWLST